MAKFNPDVQVNDNQSYIGFSQGQPANKALGILFEGLGNAAGTYLEGKRADEQKQFTQDVQAGVDAIDNTSMGSLFDVTGAKTAEELPSVLKAGQTKLERLAQARAQGTLPDDLYYSTQVNALAKKLRSQYPQYSDKIDDMLSNATGTSTANQLRRHALKVFEDEEKAASDETKRKDKLVGDALEKGYLSDPVVTGVYKKVTGKDFDASNFNEKALQFAIGTRAAEDADMKRAKDKLEYEAAQGTADKKKAKEVATQSMINLRDNILFSAMNATGPKGYRTGPSQMENLNQVIQKGMADGQLTPEETEGIIAIVNRVELDLNSKAEQLLTTTDNNGFSFAKYLTDPKDREDVKAVLLAPIQNIKEALGGKEVKWGILRATERQVTAKTLGNELVKQGDFNQMLNQAKSMYGEEFVNSVLREAENDPTFANLPENEKAAAQKITAMLMNGATPSEAASVAVQGGVSAGGINAGLQTWIKQISTGDITKEQAVAAAKGLYSERNNQFLSDFSKQNPEQLFYTLTNPAFVEKLKGTEAEADIYSWSLYQAKTLMQPLANQIYDTQVFSDASQITYDPGKKRFVFNGPEEATSYLSGGSPRMLDSYKAKLGNEAVAKINRYLDVLEPIAAANGTSIEDTLSVVFMGRDYKNLQKEGSIWTRMRDSFFGSLGGEDGPLGKKTMDKAKENLPQNPLDPKPQGSRSIINYRNQQATRNLDLTNALEGKISTAVSTVFGPGYSVQVFSGGQPKKGTSSRRTGSIRHDQGKAADVYIVGPDGKRVTDTKELDKLKQYWLANDMGSVGTYMRGAGMHLDEWTKEELLAGMAQNWRY